MPVRRVNIRKDELQRTLKDQVEKGDAILEEGTSVFGSLSHAKNEERIWHNYNRTFIEKAFGEELLEEYDSCVPADFEIGIFQTKDEADFVNRMKARILWLRTYLKQVPLMLGPTESKTKRSIERSTGEVFIIHGHDTGARDAVRLFVKNIGLTPIVLENKPNEGMPLDKKLEKYSAVDYAIAILTPDDNGNPRPNASLELGWFRRAIGPTKVSILYKEGTKIPSDVGSVGRILLDSHEGWQRKLAREIKESGVPIDPDWFLKD